MKTFNEIYKLNEARTSEAILKDEITKYINKVKKQLPEKILRIIYITQKYNLDSRDKLEVIKNATRSELSKLSVQYNIPIEEINDLQIQLKGLKTRINLLPQYQSKMEREEIESGRLALDELTIDLNSTSGRNAAAKIFMPVVLKVVNTFVGKSHIPTEDLISTAMEAMVDAMNNWDKQKGSFKTYLGFRVRQALLNYINSYNSIASGGNDYAYKKGMVGQAQSIDNFLHGDDDIDTDRLSFLGIENKSLNRNEEKVLKDIYKLIEDNFNSRKIEIFYRFFGINGYKREMSKDIAREFSMSLGNIRNSIINPILKFLKTNPKAMEILDELKDIYTESLMIELFNMDSDIVKESLINDDTFILLEDLTRWNYRTPFLNAMRDVFSTMNTKEQSIIRDFLTGDFKNLDGHYKQYKFNIIDFLNKVYPDKNFNNFTDVDILEYMTELSEYYKKYN